MVVSSFSRFYPPGVPHQSFGTMLSRGALLPYRMNASCDARTDSGRRFASTKYAFKIQDCDSPSAEDFARQGAIGRVFTTGQVRALGPHPTGS